MVSVELNMFGRLYPMLAAYPTVAAVAAALPHWHPWCRRPDRLLEDAGIDNIDMCIRRISEYVGWQSDNIIVVVVPAELLPYVREEERAWLAERRENADEAQ